MDSATEDLYLQKIEEFVYDEDKIVTFKWLCCTLDISTSDSKRLLEKYVTDHRDSKPDELAVTYILSGTLDENVFAVTVVKENELRDKRDAFFKVDSQQIFSVQKHKEVDFNAISLVDFFDMHNPRETPIIGSILSKNCVKRVFKQKKALPPPPPPTNKEKTSFFTKLPQTSIEKDTKSTASNNSKSPVTSVSKQNSVKEKGTPPTKSKQNGGITSFFTKAVSKADVKPESKVKKEIKTEIKMEEEESSALNEGKVGTKRGITHLVDTDSESEDIISPTPTVKSKENQNPKRSVKRQKKENKKNAPNPKRRKRIVEHNDSDSDDIFGNDEMDESIREDVIENSDEDSEPILLQPKPFLGPKNKKRKLVNRTFTDEEGYVITRKEWVEESASEEEEKTIKLEESEKKEIKEDKTMSVEKTKHSSEDKSSRAESDSSGDKVVNGKAKTGKGKKAVPTNQQTLMNFFKRK